MKDGNKKTRETLVLENTYAKLPQLLYSEQEPSKVPNPKVVVLNEMLIKSLGMNLDFMRSQEGVQFLTGNKILSGTTPIAQAYAGHQFGYFTMLGDGRACLLGEYVTQAGERYDIQLKGSGRTRYSRGGDGKAVLGPMLREYVISEAMDALGIPTTRSLAVSTTGEDIMREGILPGAILTRVAKSHIRVGTFQFVANWGKDNDLKVFSDYTIQRLYPDGLTKENPYQYLLDEVVKSQAQLVARWQLVGFIHGVMNTDNMSISGETIDYGPCAFMDVYDPNTVFSSIDTQGRYAYKNQPSIAAWNIARFAETLLPLLSADPGESIQLAQRSISMFHKLYQENWYAGMREKLGLFEEKSNDRQLIDELLSVMLLQKVDFTNTFLDLTIGRRDSQIYHSKQFLAWEEQWNERRRKQNESIDDSTKLMQKRNPILIPRNHRVEEALDAAQEQNLSLFTSLVNALRHPYDYSLVNEHQYYRVVPEPTGCPYKTYCGT